MAIKMDGHTITSLQLKASDGSEVTKQLTEEGTIPTPTGSLSITANGTYDVTNYASVIVNVTSAKMLESISAVYTQGATVVYPSTSLDSLKDNLVVTAVYDDESTEEVVDYTLSGTLAEGTSVVTVSYMGKTTAFNVTVSAEHSITYTITNTLTHCVNSNAAISVGEGESYSATISADEGYTLDSVTCTMGGVAQSVVDGVINIASVTGDIVITASAVEQQGLPDYVEFVTVTPPSDAQSLTFNTSQAKVALVDARCDDVTSDASDNVGRVYNYLGSTQPDYSDSVKVSAVSFYKNDGTGEGSSHGWLYTPFTQSGASVTIKSDRGAVFEGGKTYNITIIGDKVEEVSQ